MNFLIDGLILLIFITFCVVGYKNGFIKMLISFLKNIIALIVASVFSTRVGAFLYEKFFKGFFEDMTLERLCSWLGIDKSASPDIGPLIDAEHSEFFGFIEKLGFDIDTINEQYANLGKNAGDAMVEFIAKPIANTVSNVVAFILLFIVTVLAVKLIGFILGKIAKLPVLNATNRILGLILGALLSVVFILIFVALVDMLLPYVKINAEHLTTQSFEEGTILYKYLTSQTRSGLIGNIITKIGVK